jgi:hypothetical protein
MAQIVYGPYPMTIAQMSAWAKQVSAFDANECARALHYLGCRVVPFRRER